MPLAGLILGVINIAIVLAVFILVGLLIVWLLKLFNYAVPDEVRKVYLFIVALIGLYMLVALLFGMPTMHVLPFR